MRGILQISESYDLIPKKSRIKESAMSLKTILITLLVNPISLLFEVIYSVVFNFTNNSFVSYVCVCLAVAFLLLASAVCLERLIKRLKSKKGIGKKKGKIEAALSKYLSDKALFYLKNSFGIAALLAYDVALLIISRAFLESFSPLSAIGVGAITNLASPDAVLNLFGRSFNLIPIVFTLINLISCVLCSKKNTFKLSLPLYALTVFAFAYSYSADASFTVCLLISSVLIFAKTLIDLFKSSELITDICISAVGIIGGVYLIFFYGDPTVKLTILYAAFAFVFQIPLICFAVRKQLEKRAMKKGERVKRARPKALVFFSGCAFLAVFCGVCIPSIVISSAPQDFVDIYYYHNPLLYIVSSACIAFGAFIIWSGALYLMSRRRTRAVLDVAVWVACGLAAVNYFFFGKNLGIMTPALKYEDGFDLKLNEQLVNFLILFAVAAVMVFVAVKFKKIVPSVLLIGMAAVVAMSVTNIFYTYSAVVPLKEQAQSIHDEEPHFSLSKNGKNVIVLMTDRAISCYVPYLMNEKPELTEMFDGFTFYSNTISFGGNTNFGAPPIYGGYEYTPAEMNARDEESLQEKNDEALKVMPVLFDSNDYEVTVFDPPYAGYQNIPDLSIYDEYPDINTGITKGAFTDESSKRTLIENNHRNFFCYSILKTAPLVLQETLYNDATYNNTDVVFDDTAEVVEYKGQVADTVFTSEGLEPFFMDAYNVLDNMDYITDIDNGDSDTFLLMMNGTPHNPILLQEPDYVPSMVVDNTEYEAEKSDRYTLNGRTLKMETLSQYAHYECNMANLLQLGKWFDYLRENDVYDNTRIIIVADHGGIMHQLEELELDDGFDTMAYCPLLMVKDFNSKGFTVSDEFMTNADVPTLALEGLIDNPVNPFTGKAINSDEKTAHDQYVISSNDWSVEVNNGNTFLPADWYSVHDNLWDKNNWTKIASDAVITYEDK